MNARDLYQAAIMEHARSPRHAAALEPADSTARKSNPLCGDRVDVGVRLDGETIAALGVVARGCALCVAAGSMMAERLAGGPTAAAAELAGAVKQLLAGDPVDLELGDLAVFGVVREYPSRKTCVTLPFDALAEALR